MTLEQKVADVLEDIKKWPYREDCRDKIRLFRDKFGKRRKITIEEAKEVFSNKELAEYLCMAGEDWPNKRYTKKIAEALIKTGDARQLYRAGLFWPDKRYTKKIAEALIKTGDAGYLYQVGVFWPNKRYTKKIAKALAKASYAWHFYEARACWSKGRIRQLEDSLRVQNESMPPIF